MLIEWMMKNQNREWPHSWLQITSLYIEPVNLKYFSKPKVLYWSRKLKRRKHFEKVQESKELDIIYQGFLLWLLQGQPTWTQRSSIQVYGKQVISKPKKEQGRVWWFIHPAWGEDAPAKDLSDLCWDERARVSCKTLDWDCVLYANMQRIKQR